MQRDHVRLLKLCVARLARDGLILFSNNARRFKLDRDALGGCDVRDITPSTLPFDFRAIPASTRASRSAIASAPIESER